MQPARETPAPAPLAGSRFADYRNLAAVVLGLTLLQAATTGLSAFGILTLAARGASAFEIGGVAAGYALGFLLGALRATAVVRAIGHIRTFAAFAAAAAIATLLLFSLASTVVWMALQVLLGFCVSSLLTSGESWVADAAPAERRGRLLAFYMVASKMGQIAGPALVAAAAPGAASGFMLVAAMFAASLIPVSATRRSQPEPPSREPFGLLQLWRTAPAAFIAAFTAGAVNGAVLQLYALFSSATGPDASLVDAAAFNAALATGAILLQWPAGWVSDRIDRRLVVAALAMLGSLASLGLFLGAFALPWPGILALGFAWGAGSLSFYGIAVAHAVDRAPPGQTTGAMSGILVIWAIGAFAGPLVAGSLMSGPAGAPALFAFAGAGLFVLAGSMVIRRIGVAPPEDADKSRFVISPATSASLVLLDPRTDAPAPADTPTPEMESAT